MYDVIIPCRNEEKTIGALVKTFRQHPVINHVIVVVDNMTTDNTADVALSYGLGANTVVLYGPPSGGMGENIYRGLDYVTTPRVILFDGDLSGLTDDHIHTLTRGLSPFVMGVPDIPIADIFDFIVKENRWQWFPNIIKSWPWVTGCKVAITDILRGINMHGYLATVQITDAHKRMGIEPDFRFLQGLYSPWRMTAQRMEEMERDRKWGKEHGILE